MPKKRKATRELIPKHATIVTRAELETQALKYSKIIGLTLEEARQMDSCELSGMGIAGSQLSMVLACLKLGDE